MQRVDVEPRAAADEEHRDEEPVADRLDLAPELDVRQVLVRVDDPQQRAGDERAEDRLDARARPPSATKQREQQRSRSGRRAGPTCPRALAASSRPGATDPPSTIASPTTTTSSVEADEQDDLRPRAGRSGRAGREEQGDEQDRAELRERGRGEHRLPEVGLDLAGVADDRDDEPERRRRQHDRDEERVPDRSRPAAARTRTTTASANDATNASAIVADAAAQPGRVDLEPGEEQQEARARTVRGR